MLGGVWNIAEPVLHDIPYLLQHDISGAFCRISMDYRRHCFVNSANCSNERMEKIYSF